MSQIDLLMPPTGAALETDPVMDQAIRNQLPQLNTRLGEVLRQEASRRDQTGRHVADRAVQGSGLTGSKADGLRQRREQTAGNLPRWQRKAGGHAASQFPGARRQRFLRAERAQTCVRSVTAKIRADYRARHLSK